MPSGLIDEEDGVGSWCDRLGDFHEMQVHRFDIAEGQDQGGSLSLLRADGSEDVGRGGSLVPRSARASAALGPPAGDLVFLADTSLVLEPNFYLADVDCFFARDFIQARWELFFKSLDGSLGLRMMARSRRELAVAHRAKLPAQGLLGDRDAELLVDPLRKIDQPPAHDTVDRRDRAALDHPHNRLALHIIEPRGLAWRFAVKQAGSTPRIEAHHPVPDDLQRHGANPRRLGAGRPIVNGRQRS